MTALPKDWLFATELSGKKIKVVIKGTKVLPTFRGGQYEGCVASFIAVEERNMVKVRLLQARLSTLSIPCKFVHPFPVSSVGEKVVVIRGSLMDSEYIIYKSCQG